MSDQRWNVTLPSMRSWKDPSDGLIVVSYDDAKRFGFLGIPVIGREVLTSVEEATVWKRAGEHADRLYVSLQLPEVPGRLVREHAERAWVLGYLAHATEDGRAKCPIARDQLRSLAQVLSGWPL